MQFTAEHVLSDQIAADLPKTACDIHTAYFVIQGQNDVITPTQAAIEYFKCVKAPKKGIDPDPQRRALRLHDRLRYERIGYLQWNEYFQWNHKKEQTEQIHIALVQQIASMFPDSISVVHNPPKRRRLLLVDRHILVSVYLCRSSKRRNGKLAWRHDPVAGEKQNITLLCTLNARNDGVKHYYLFQTLGRFGHYKFGPGNKWLRGAKRLKSLSELCDAVREAARV